MKYIVMDVTNGDLFNTECGTLEEAIAAADNEFFYLTEAEKKKRTGFYILESVNPDEEAENHFDGEIVKTYI